MHKSFLKCFLMKSKACDIYLITIILQYNQNTDVLGPYTNHIFENNMGKISSLAIAIAHRPIAYGLFLSFCCLSLSFEKWK